MPGLLQGQVLKHDLSILQFGLAISPPDFATLRQPDNQEGKAVHEQGNVTPDALEQTGVGQVVFIFEKGRHDLKNTGKGS